MSAKYFDSMLSRRCKCCVFLWFSVLSHEALFVAFAIKTCRQTPRRLLEGLTPNRIHAAEIQVHERELNLQAPTDQPWRRFSRNNLEFPQSVLQVNSSVKLYGFPDWCYWMGRLFDWTFKMLNKMQLDAVFQIKLDWFRKGVDFIIQAEDKTAHVGLLHAIRNVASNIKHAPMNAIQLSRRAGLSTAQAFSRVGGTVVGQVLKSLIDHCNNLPYNCQGVVGIMTLVGSLVGMLFWVPSIVGAALALISSVVSGMTLSVTTAFLGTAVGKGMGVFATSHYSIFMGAVLREVATSVIKNYICYFVSATAFMPILRKFYSWMKLRTPDVVQSLMSQVARYANTTATKVDDASSLLREDTIEKPIASNIDEPNSSAWKQVLAYRQPLPPENEITIHKFNADFVATMVKSIKWFIYVAHRHFFQSTNLTNEDTPIVQDVDLTLQDPNLSDERIAGLVQAAIHIAGDAGEDVMDDKDLERDYIEVQERFAQRDEWGDEDQLYAHGVETVFPIEWDWEDDRFRQIMLADGFPR